MTSAAPSCLTPPAPGATGVQAALGTHLRGFLRGAGVLDPHVVKVLHRLVDCQTEAMGAHSCLCVACGWRGRAFNGCGDRHCPTCGGAKAAKWLRAREARMLPVPHFQVVFTLPAALRPLAAAHPRFLYPLLLRVASRLLQETAQERLKAQVGITAALHTWDRKLRLHPHVHLLVTAGGLTPDGTRWVLGRRFRGRILEHLIAANGPDGALELDEDAQKQLAQTLRTVARRTRPGWVVHTEPPRGRTAAQVTKYLARYVGRVAISDRRIHEVTASTVTFQGRHAPGRGVAGTAAALHLGVGLRLGGLGLGGGRLGLSGGTPQQRQQHPARHPASRDPA